MNPREKSFDNLNGVPLHYAREPIAPYGTIGKKFTFYATKSFHSKLEKCFDELFSLCPLGKPEVITTAGTFVDKPRSYHRLGRAFDLDGIFWPSKTFITINYPADRPFYLAVEAIIRKHFGTVLNYLYDQKHRDHLHIDDGTKVGFSSTSRSRILFLQVALKYLFDQPILVDGIYGSETKKAIKIVFKQKGISNTISTNSGWDDFLTRCAEIGFVESIVLSNPLTLIESIYDIVGSENIPETTAKRIETALTTFVNNHDVKQFLENYRT